VLAPTHLFSLYFGASNTCPVLYARVCFADVMWHPLLVFGCSRVVLCGGTNHSFFPFVVMSSPVGKLSTRHRKPSGLFTPSSIAGEGDSAGDSLLAHFKTTLRELGLDAKDVDALSAFCFGRRISSVRASRGRLQFIFVCSRGLCCLAGCNLTFRGVVQDCGRVVGFMRFRAFLLAGCVQSTVPWVIAVVKRERDVNSDGGASRARES
jgi:hypothetical protein